MRFQISHLLYIGISQALQSCLVLVAWNNKRGYLAFFCRKIWQHPWPPTNKSLLLREKKELDKEKGTAIVAVSSCISSGGVVVRRRDPNKTTSKNSWLLRDFFKPFAHQLRKSVYICKTVLNQRKHRCRKRFTMPSTDKPFLLLPFNHRSSAEDYSK
jgi:hypothetical protein